MNNLDEEQNKITQPYQKWADLLQPVSKYKTGVLGILTPAATKAADDPYIYSEENMKFLRESIDQIENRNGKVHELKENPRNIS